MQSRSRVNRPDLFGHCNGHNNDREFTEEAGLNASNNKQKKGLKSLQLLASILLSDMGKLGARDLLGLVAIAVSLFYSGSLCFMHAFNF